MLAFDALHGHLSEELKAKLVTKNRDLVVIPIRTTSQVQPPDVSVNKQI
jgi:hypothetical protein